MLRGFVLLGREPGGVGRAIRCVERVTPERLGVRPATAARGIDNGCVVTVPAGMGGAGIKPTGCGDLTAGEDAMSGGV
jgi:hypothetical protein